MKDYGLAGKVALVTGAGRGMGQAISLAFAREGAKVVAAEIDRDSGEATARAIIEAGGQARFVHCDVADPASLDALMADALAVYGRIDCACNNAAIDQEAALLADVDDAMFDRTVAINFAGVFGGMKRQVRQMLAQGDGGTIVNMVSINAARPQPTGAVYSGTKAAVVAMSKAAAVAYASQGVRINMVAPGAIDTPMLRENMDTHALDPARVAPTMSVNGRFGQVEEIAEAVLWLSSGLSTYCFGHVLAVDGGYLSR